LNQPLFRRVHETFLAVSDANEQSILGYYSLSIARVAYAQTPESIKRELSHHAVPMFRLCRLAADRSMQRQGLTLTPETAFSHSTLPDNPHGIGIS